MALPQEIWLLIGQELADRRDFRTLYACARVNSNLAHIALQLLYSIHEQSPVCVGETVFTLGKWACLWRSIIISSLGQTVFPYCLWVCSLPSGLAQSSHIILTPFCPPPPLPSQMLPSI